jgi:hypothetical protein
MQQSTAFADTLARLHGILALDALSRCDRQIPARIAVDDRRPAL